MLYYKLDYINVQLWMKFVELVQIIEKVMGVAAKCLCYLTPPSLYRNHIESLDLWGSDEPPDRKACGLWTKKTQEQKRRGSFPSSEYGS